MDFYITTPLYYINDKPHIGTVYSTVVADTLKRYHQLLGYDTFLLTGTDEHGQKSSQSAKEQKLSPQAYCDKMAQQFQNTWELLDISHNLFFRTTYPWHKQVVRSCLQTLYDKHFIYKAEYKGWYCVSEETFYTSKDLVNGKSPNGKEVQQIQEENYFFKMSHFQQALIQHILKHPQFIQPEHRKNEVLGFLKQPLADLCISRPKERLSWGVELPFDPQFVTYVWVDALLNYITGVGYSPARHFAESATKPTVPSVSAPLSSAQSTDSALSPSLTSPPNQGFKKWWLNSGGAIHLIGKDILIPHAVYWPSLLLALDLPLPKTILAHGWLLNQSQEKMSKSQGDVLDPLALLQSLDADSLRYFLIHDIPLGRDAPVSPSIIVRRINEDLANNLGNLLRRTTTLLAQHFNDQIPSPAPTPDDLTKNLKEQGESVAQSIKTDILKLQPGMAIEKIIHLLNETNKYLEQTAPWTLIKTDKTKAGVVLRTSLEMIYLCSVLLKPVLPKKMSILLDSLSCPSEWPVTYFKTGAFPKSGTKIQKIPPLFPRIDI